jgi:uncharacterized protein (AIM24 family)
MIKAVIQNETIRAEAGALHYMRGQIEMESKAPSAGGILKGMVSGETVFKPTYTGTGEIYFGPPIFGEYIILELNNQEWILDRGAYVCSDIGVEVDVYRNKAASALLGGEGLFQTLVRGTGKVVIQSPGKAEWIQLNGEKLSVDGSFAIARSSTLSFAVQRASKSLIGSMTSGEGLLNTFQGQGYVLLAPVPNLYQNLINQARYIPAQQPTAPKGLGRGCLGFLGGGVFIFAIFGALALVLFN